MTHVLDLAYELHDLVLTMDRQAAAVLKPLGLTLRHHTALVIIEQHPGLRGRDLANGLKVTPAAATGVVRTLKSAGLIEDSSCPGDGNRQSLHLTPAGRTMLAASTDALSGSFDDVVRRAGHDPNHLAEALHDITKLLRSSEPIPAPSHDS